MIPKKSAKHKEGKQEHQSWKSVANFVALSGHTIAGIIALKKIIGRIRK